MSRAWEWLEKLASFCEPHISRDKERSHRDEHRAPRKSQTPLTRALKLEPKDRYSKFSQFLAGFGVVAPFFFPPTARLPFSREKLCQASKPNLAADWTGNLAPLFRMFQSPQNVSMRRTGCRCHDSPDQLCASS